MPLLILICILAVPYFEFLVFLKVGNMIGGWNAFFLTVITAFLGIYLIRLEGFDVLRRLKENMAQGISPAEEIAQGLFLAIAGLFFLMPGFLTDSAALLLAITPIRRFLSRHILVAGNFSFQTGTADDHLRAHDMKYGTKPGQTIDGEYTTQDDEDSDTEINKDPSKLPKNDDR